MTEFIPPRKPERSLGSRAAIGVVGVLAIVATVLGAAMIVGDHFTSDPNAYTEFSNIR